MKRTVFGLTLLLLGACVVDPAVLGEGPLEGGSKAGAGGSEASSGGSTDAAPQAGAPTMQQGQAGDEGSGGTGSSGGNGGSASRGGAAAFGGSAAGTSSPGAAGSSTGAGGHVGDPPRDEACVGMGISAEESAAVGLPNDFDHDGSLDLATANVDGSVSVFLGNGAGCFASKVTYSTGLAPDLTWWDFPPVLAAGDLDANGTTDLVTTNPDALGLSVLLGDPGGTFAPAERYALDDFIVGLVVVDWDRDDVQDIVVGTLTDNENSYTLMLLSGSGRGTFAPPTAIWSGSHLYSINVGDLDHDDRPDLVVSQLGVKVLLNGPEGTPSDGGEYELVASGPSSVNLTDVNGDDNLDVVVVSGCNKGAPEGIDVLLGVGDGTFAESLYNDGQCGRHENVVTASVTEGNTIDLVRFADLVLPGAGNGTFLPGVLGTSTTYESLLTAGDWNHDEIVDLAVSLNDRVLVRLGHGDGTFGPLAPKAP